MTNLESGQRTSPFLSYCWDDLDMAYMLEALLGRQGRGTDLGQAVPEAG